MVIADDIIARLPSNVEADAKVINLYIKDAYEAISLAFALRGRSFEDEVENNPSLDVAADLVVRQAVTAPVMIGQGAIYSQVSSTTGSQSDSVSFSNKVNDWITIGGIKLTPEHLALLGLLKSSSPRFSFPGSLRYPRGERYGTRNVHW